ncbi:MAG TPA: amino acid ABC transporter permease [Bdellovibrionota bacterium]|jgi:polar amino acid transport system permease protein|nr:amino acid ABC transporter permease [Bdellovibrionota bacterium]
MMNPKLRQEILSHALVIVLLIAGLFWAFNRLEYTWNWYAVWDYRQKFWQGLVTTIWISALSLVLSTTIGMAVALARQYGNVLVRALARIYVELVRGTPLLVQILVFFYVIANVVGLENRYTAGVLSLSIFAGAYMSEIIRGGINAVGASQLESAKAIGLTRLQTLRYVVLPQAARVALPPAAGQFVSLIKDSSLLSVIAISELTLNAQEVNSFTYSTLESYIPLALLYLLLTLPLALVIRQLERSLRYET